MLKYDLFLIAKIPPVDNSKQCMITKNDGPYAAVVENGKVRYQLIEIGRDYGNKVEISNGLKANDIVLLDAPDNLDNGESVQPILSVANNDNVHS